MASDLHNLHGVEIFRTGTWNGDVYTVADLQEMVDAFPLVGYRPPIKLGHDEASGDRAYGWVTGLRRVGEKLLADFSDIPSAVYKIIKERGYDAVSAEIFFNLSRNGREFARALKAVALLGAETPGVAGLAPLRIVANSIPGASFRIYVINSEAMTMSSDPGEALLDLAHQYMSEHPSLGFREALAQVKMTREGQTLARAYNNGARRGGSTSSTPVRSFREQHAMDHAKQALENEVLAKARALIDSGFAGSMNAAMSSVFRSDPTLAKRYAEITRTHTARGKIMEGE